MTKYCIFGLYGPMASWGEIATGEDRHSSDHPSKSAIIGLIGAALGIRRDQEDLHSQLTHSIGMASLIYEPGTPVEDFHTIQAPPQSELNKGSHFHTRKDELSIGADALYTVISRREYRCDTYVSICLWERGEGSPYGLEQIVTALNEPVFSLYLGRKSCPPGLPVNAVTVEAPSILDAFKKAGNVPLGLSDRFTFPPKVAMHWDSDGVAGVQTSHVDQRRDEILSRKRWTFSNRFEHFEMVTIPRPGG